MHVLIDVSNVCRDHRGWQATDVRVAKKAGLPLPPPEKERKDAVLERYFAVREAARQKWGKDATVRGWADASLIRRFADAERESYRRLVTSGEIREATEADDPLLADAKTLHALVISKDNFRGKRGPGAHDWLNGTADRLWEPRVNLVDGRVEVSLIGRRLSDISDSSVRRGANDDLIKANRLTDQDLEHDYRCTNATCPHGRRAKLAVFPMRTGTGGKLLCPACQVEVERLGRRSEPVKRWSNQKAQRRQARLTDGADDLAGLPPLDGLPRTGDLGGFHDARTTPAVAPAAPDPAAPDPSWTARTSPATPWTTPQPAVPPTVADTPGWDNGPGGGTGAAAPSWQGAAQTTAPVLTPEAAPGARALHIEVDVRGRRVHTVTVRAGLVVLGRLADIRQILPKGELGLDIAADLGEEAWDVSRRHMVIRLTDEGTVTLLDTSFNGVCLDGRPMARDTHVAWTGQGISILDEQVRVRLRLSHG
ncbi:FHA domain-containing protein [Streptomyces populi]